MNNKVLFFVNSLAGGGAERVCLNLAQELFQQGYFSDFITLYQEKNMYELPTYIRLKCLNIKKEDSMVGKISQIISKIPQINVWIKEEKYALISAHLQMSHLLAAFSSVRNKTLFVMHNPQWPHDPNHSLTYKIGLRSLFLKRHIIAVSDGVRKELIDDYRMSEQQVHTIYNPFPLQVLRDMGNSPAPYPNPYIIFLGRLTAQKRPDIAIKLFYESEICQKYDLVILGDGALRPSVEKLIKEYNLRNSVHLAGFQEKPYPWIAHARLMLSTSDYEACPMNLVEALACETGVVAANCRFGPNEILTGELAKYLIDPYGDYEGSLKILRNAVENYPQINLSMLKKFDASDIAKQYLKKWNELFS